VHTHCGLPSRHDSRRTDDGAGRSTALDEFDNGFLQDLQGAATHVLHLEHSRDGEAKWLQANIYGVPVNRQTRLN
jgi:hypothetical protein